MTGRGAAERAWPSGEPDARQAELQAAMGKVNIQALWTQAADLMPGEPAPRAVPWLWRWDIVLALAADAGRAVPVGRGGERRALALANPGLGGLPFATPTLWGAMQYLNARESAPAHRHTAAAIRFVLRGEGVWTTVNGEPCPMSRGDLVLTPSMTWHEHHSGADEPMVWFDGLDLPLVNGLDAGFFEPAAADYLDSAAGPAASRSAALYGHPGLLPGIRPDTDRHSPLMVYRREHTERALAELSAATGTGDAEVRFVDPVRGRDALPTMRCAMRRLAAGARTPTTRAVGSSIIVVFSGHGRTVIDGTAFGWGPGDTLAVPSWCAVDHEAAQTAYLFVLSDAPVIEALRLDRTEVLKEQQAVRAAWSGG
ncbi:MAG TPA: cupin domain-containing protein [Streptosporangiaceae bacterium]|nr:cupin domain-containing protein [Streptosporangiaceae bacterium]